MSKKHKTSNPNDSFFAMPKVILNHPDFLSMSWAAQALLMHIGSFYNGFNNGSLAIPHSIMKERGWCKGTLEKAKIELIKKKWIITTRQGTRFFHCSMYALSWKIINESKAELDLLPPDFEPRKLKKP